MIEFLKFNENQWLIKRKEKTYPVKTIEQIFVYLLAFNIKLNLIEDAVIKIEMGHFNFARFSGNKVELEKK